MKEYWNEQYDDLYPGIVFRFKKINPIELINLVTENMNFEDTSIERKNEFTKQCLLNVEWSKNSGANWFPLIDRDENPHLPELVNNPMIAFDIFFAFRRDVITPVFTESRTYQNLIEQSRKRNSSNSNSKQ